jgi:hypothetical protein
MNIYNFGQLEKFTLIPSAAITADGNGTGVDLLAYEGDICIIMNSAAGTGNPDNTLDVKIQHSDDNSSFSDVTSGAFTQVTTAASVQKMVLNSDSLKRYIRAVKDVGGTTPSFIAGIVGVAVKKYLDQV